jgi:hypothetical protein
MDYVEVLMFPIDPVTLANQVIQALTPLMPFLSGIGAGIGTAIVAKFGEDVYDQSKKQGQHLYEAIEHRFEQEKTIDQGSARRALQNFTYEPDRYKDVFKATLLTLLQNDTAFTDELGSILDTSPALQQIIRAGDNAIVSDNEQSNTFGSGVQLIEGTGAARIERNKQNISNE